MHLYVYNLLIFRLETNGRKRADSLGQLYTTNYQTTNGTGQQLLGWYRGPDVNSKANDLWGGAGSSGRYLDVLKNITLEMKATGPYGMKVLG